MARIAAKYSFRIQPEIKKIPFKKLIFRIYKFIAERREL